MERRVFEVKISSRGQMVIPKVLREKYNLREGSRVKVIAGDGEIIIKPLFDYHMDHGKAEGGIASQIDLYPVIGLLDCL